MKKIIALCSIILLTHIACATQIDFQRRFGSDSIQYNTPLYFANTQQHTTQDKRPKKRFREQLRETMHKDVSKKKRMHQKSVKHSQDLFDL